MKVKPKCTYRFSQQWLVIQELLALYKIQLIKIYNSCLARFSILGIFNCTEGEMIFVYLQCDRLASS
jgi:hypothetical protein